MIVRGTKMSLLAASLGLMLMGSDAALAADEPTDLCKIADWRHWHVEEKERLYIEGRTTCESGKVSIFAYTGPADTRQFIGGDSAGISDHIFKARIKPVHVEPDGLVIEFIIRRSAN